jgi:UTP-glucose-1-phosphate uridylyltransferase
MAHFFWVMAVVFAHLLTFLSADSLTFPGTRVLGLKKTAEADIVNFGVVAGVWEEPGRLLSVSEFAEKPNLEYART